MTYYVALIHKDEDGCYGVSFPDVPGAVTVGDTIDEAMQNAEELLAFAAEDWINPDGSTGLRTPRTIDELRDSPDLQEELTDAVVAFVPLAMHATAAA